MVGIEPADQIQQLGRDLPRRFVGGLGQGVDSVAAHPADGSLLRQPAIGGQRRCAAGVSIDRSAGPTPVDPTHRQMRPRPPTIRAGVAAGPGQPGDRHQPSRLQLLLPPGGQRDQPSVSLSRQIADQCVEPCRQIGNGINRTAITAITIYIDFTACATAGRVQHLHTINTKQPL